MFLYRIILFGYPYVKNTFEFSADLHVNNNIWLRIELGCTFTSLMKNNEKELSTSEERLNAYVQFYKDGTKCYYWRLWKNI